MPALIAVSDGNALMAANVTRGHPWHRLGKQLTTDMTIAEALKESGSDDVVVPATLYTRNDDGTYEEVADYMAAKSDKYGTLGVHSPGFNIKQRSEILEMAYDFTGLDPDGAHIDTIGNIGDGDSDKPKKFFAYIRVPDLVIDPSGIADTIERGLFVATSFNGTLPNIMGYSNIRVVCSNTLSMAMSTASQVVKAKHTRNADERMQQMAVAMQYIGAVEQETVANAEKMLRVDGDKAIDTLLDHFYPIKDIKLSDVAKTRRSRERGDVRLLYNGTGNLNVDKAGATGWAAYNALVEYVDHASGVKVGKQTDKAGLQRAQRSVMPSKFVDMKVTASKIVMEMADA